MARRKSSNTGILSYLGIAFIGYLLLGYTGGRVYANLSFGRPRLRFGRLRPDHVEVTLNIPVTNDNPVGMPVDGLIGQVTYGGLTLFPFQLAQSVFIQPGQTTQVTFNGLIRFAEVGGNIATIISSGQLLQDLVVEGQAFIKGGVIPFRNTIGIG